MKFDLARMRSVMAELGNPQDDYPSVHVAGTNGKGSVTAMIASGLARCGLKVGMYTSPHLEQINERFQINGRMISDTNLGRLVRSSAKRFPHLTQFEFLTTLAFQWFSDEKIDVAVVEVGLGGRLDATNVLRRVLASVITNIDFDHMNWLGHTIEKIAFEKAGIIKPGVPLVCGATKGFSVIKSVANKRHSPVVRSRARLRPHSLRLLGAHQKQNARLALQALDTLRARLPGLEPRAYTEAVQNTFWPGRFERFLVGSRRKRRVVVLDGAHNTAGCRVLVRTLRSEKLVPASLVFGVLKDKAIREMVRVLSPIAERVTVVPVSSPRTADPSEVSRNGAWRGKAEAARSIDDAWKTVLNGPDSRPIVVAGSLYLVGEVRRKFLRRRST